MNQILRRCIRNAALAAVLCVCAVQVFAQAAGEDWQALIDQHAAAMKQGQSELGIDLAQKALELSETRLGPVHADVARSLLALAETYRAVGQYEKALSLQKRALAIREAVLGPEHPDTALSRSNLALTYVSLGQYDKALPLVLQALEINEKLRGPEDSSTVSSMADLAAIYAALAQYDMALPLLQRVLEINTRVHGVEHPNTVKSLSSLAATYRTLAQYKEALSLQQRALEINEKLFGPNHPDFARSLNELALTHLYLAQYDKALPLQERALAILEASLGPEHPEAAKSLNNLAATYSGMAQCDKALPLHQRALAIREKVYGLEHPVTAISLENLAVTYHCLDHDDMALLLEQRALTIEERSFGPEHPYTAISLSNLASIFSQMKQYDQALPLAQRALAIREKVLGAEHPDIASSLENLAATYVYLVQYDRALPLQERALAICEVVLGPEHASTALSLNNLAYIFHLIKLPDLSVAFFKAAVNSYQMQREQIARIGSSELRSYTFSISQTYKDLAYLLTEQGRVPEAQIVLDMLKEEEQFDFIRRSATSDPRSTRIGYNATEQVWMNRYRQIANQLAAMGAEDIALQKQAKLGLSEQQKQRQKTLAADLQVAQKAFDTFLGEMREAFARQSAVRTVETEELSQKSMSDQQSLIKGLGNDVALLRYYVTDDKVGMLMTTAGVPLAHSSNISAKELNRQIAEFSRLLRDPKSNPLPTAQALYTLLVAPVAHDLEQTGAKTVMLSLDGALRYLPFAALHDGQRYLVQRWNLPMYTSVTRNRLRDAVMPQWQAAGLGVTRALGEFSALPAVKAEMSNIIKTAGGGVLPGEVYLDGAFTAQRLQDVSKRNFQLLHVASHFRFSPGTEVNSFLLLGDGQQLTLGDIRTQNFRFDNVDLLTLSACDTGLGGGRDEKGREIEGFGVIAQQQGAKAVLATLWPVADQSTATLMAEMYRRRQDQHLTKIEALRQAQLSLLAQPRYAHPFYWAPFILMGNWK